MTNAISGAHRLRPAWAAAVILVAVSACVPRSPHSPSTATRVAQVAASATVTDPPASASPRPTETPGLSDNPYAWLTPTTGGTRPSWLPSTPTPTARLPELPIRGCIGGSGHGIVVRDGARLYVADGRSIGVFDVGDPASPVALGWRCLAHADQGSAISALAAESGWLYAIDGHGNLAVLDARDAAWPREVGHLPHLAGLAVGDGSPWVRGHLVPWGDLLFVGMSGAPKGDMDMVWPANYRVVAIDVSDRSRPRVAGSTEVGTAFGGLARVGDHLVAVTNDWHDCADTVAMWVFAPTRGLARIARLPLNQWCVWDAVAMGDRLVLLGWANHGDAPAEMTTFDLSDPAQPVVVARAASPSRPGGSPVPLAAYPAAVATDRAQAGDPAQEFSPCPPGEARGGFIHGAAADGDHLVAALESTTCPSDGSDSSPKRVPSLEVMDWTDPTAPRNVGSLVLENGRFGRPVLVDGQAFGVTGAALAAIDLRGPGNPSLTARLPLGDDLWPVALSRSVPGLIYAGGAAIDASDPAHMRWSGDVDAVAVAADSVPAETFEDGAVREWPGGTLGKGAVTVRSGERLYVADRGSIRAYDVSDPTQARQVRAWDSPFMVVGMALSGDTLFLAAGRQGLIAVDVAR